MSWSAIKMSDADITNRKDSELQERFEALFIASGSPKEAALFCKLPGFRDNHLFYLSPAATELFPQILKDYSAAPCSPPSRAEVTPLAGHADSLDLTS